MSDTRSSNLTKALPGEALIIISTVNGFGIENGRFTPQEIQTLIWFAILGIVGVSFFSKLVTLTDISPSSLIKKGTYQTQKKGLFTAILLTVQAFAYTLVLWGKFVVPEITIITELSVLAGLFLTGAGGFVVSRKN